MNPTVTFVACFGIKQRIFFPGLYNPGFRTTSNFYWYFLSSKQIFELSRVITERVESTRRKVDIQILNGLLKKNGTNLHFDFTPMGYWNLDLVILNWFAKQGKNMDFDFLLFLEHDLYTTRTIDELYCSYRKYDACFADYQEANESWYPYRGILGKKNVQNWLKDRHLSQSLYRGLFAGAMLSYDLLLTLEKMRLPFGYCEMRMPSIITNLGYSCTTLNFPMVQYRPSLSKEDINSNSSLGIFHPVYDDLEE